LYCLTLSKKSKEKSLQYDEPPIYFSIDEMPLQAYIYVSEQGIYNYMIKYYRGDINYRLSHEFAVKLRESYSKIEDQIIDAVGVSDQFRKLFRLRNELLQYQISNQLQPDKLKEHHIARIKAEINLINQNNKNVKNITIDRQIVNIDHNIDTWKMTVKRYFILLDEKKKQLVEQKRLINNKKASA